MGNHGQIENSIRNIIYGMLKYVVVLIFPFIIRTMLIKKLGSEYAGVSSLFTSILSVLNLSELGLSTAIVYALYEPIAHKDDNKICALLEVLRKLYRLIGFFILAAGILTCPFIKFFIKGTYPQEINLYIIYILLLVNTCFTYLFNGYKSAVFVANQRSDINSKIETIAHLIMYGLQVVFLLTIGNYYVYILCMLMGTAITNLLLGIYSKKVYPNIICKGVISKAEKKKLLANVGALFGHQLDVVVITGADNIVISAFLGLNVLTMYNNYYYVVSAVLSIMIILANSFTASIGNNLVTKTKESNYKDFTDFTYLIGTINIICAVIMWVLYQDFMGIWMGNNMLFAIETVFLLVVSFYVRQMRRALLAYKTAAGIWKSDMLKPYVAAITNLVLNVLLVKQIGINGVIISTIISLMLIEIPWETYCVLRECFGKKAGKYIKIQLSMLIKLVLVGCISGYVLGVFEIDSIGGLLGKGMLSVIVVTLLVLVLSWRDKEFKNIFALTKRIMNRKKERA